MPPSSGKWTDIAPLMRLLPRSARTQIGNSRPLAPCIVRMRTALSSGSGGTTSSTRTSSAEWSRHQARNDRRSLPRVSPKARVVSRNVRMRRHASRGRGEQSANSMARRSRTRCSTRSAGPSQGRRACRAAIQAMPSSTGWSAGRPEEPGSWWFQRPPAEANSNRSSSPQPNSGERSAVARASSSVGSSTARRVVRRSRTSSVARGLKPASMRCGMPASVSASARASTGVRLRTRMAMSLGRQGRQPPFGGPPSGAGSVSSKIVQPSASAVLTTAATSAADVARRSAALRFSESLVPSSTTGGPVEPSTRAGTSGVYSGCFRCRCSMRRSNTPLTQSRMGPVVRKFCSRCTASSPKASRASR